MPCSRRTSATSSSPSRPCCSCWRGWGPSTTSTTCRALRVELHGLRRVGSTEVDHRGRGAAAHGRPGEPGTTGLGKRPRQRPVGWRARARGQARPWARSSRSAMTSGHPCASTLDVSPGSAGFNTFVLHAADYDTGAPVTGADVTLRFSLPARPSLGGSRLDLPAAGDGIYQATGGNLSIAGAWKVTAVIATGQHLGRGATRGRDGHPGAAGGRAGQRRPAHHLHRAPRVGRHRFRSTSIRGTRGRMRSMPPSSTRPATSCR